MNSEARNKFYTLAVKYVDGLNILDRGSYASRCMYAIMDGQPMPTSEGLRLSKTGTFAAESKAAYTITARILKIMNSAYQK